jgi:hypothetical protein
MGDGTPECRRQRFHAVDQLVRRLARPCHCRARSVSDRVLARKQKMDADFRGDDSGVRPGRRSDAGGENIGRPGPPERADRSGLDRTAIEFALSFFSVRTHRRIDGIFRDVGLCQLANRSGINGDPVSDRVLANVCRGALSVGCGLRHVDRRHVSLRGRELEAAGNPKSKIENRKLIGGGGGIRTHEGLRPAGFQDRSHQPLDHPSLLARRENCAIATGVSKVDRALRRSMANVAAEPHFFWHRPAERPIHHWTASYVHVNLQRVGSEKERQKEVCADCGGNASIFTRYPWTERFLEPGEPV